MNMAYYFAYGSNMSLDRIRNRNVKFKRRLPGILKGWKLVFNTIADKRLCSGYANIIPKKGSVVEGIIYEIGYEDIGKLDKYEGYPARYDKKMIIVFDKEGNKYECYVYIAQPNVIKNGLKPTRKYLNRLLKGKQFLSNKYYNNLKKVVTVD